MNLICTFGRKMGARKSLLVIFLPPFSCLFFVTCSCASAAEQPPNFVVIFADDLGYGDISCYGPTGVTISEIVGEKKNVIKSNPEVVRRLNGHLKDFAKDIADNSRPAAFVENPKPLSK